MSLKQRIMLALRILVFGLEIGRDQIVNVLSVASEDVKKVSPQTFTQIIQLLGNELGADLTYRKGLRAYATSIQQNISRRREHIVSVERRRDLAVEGLTERIQVLKADAAMEIMGTNSAIQEDTAELGNLTEVATILCCEDAVAEVA